MKKEQEQQLERIVQVSDEVNESLNIKRYSFNLPAELMDAVRGLPVDAMPWHELDDERITRIVYDYLSKLSDDVKKEVGFRHYDDPTAKLKIASKVTHDKLKQEGIDLTNPLKVAKKSRRKGHVH